MCRRGQSTLEYVVLVAVVIAALLTMRIYMKRGLQGKLRSSTDSIGAQFSPTDMTANWTIHSHSTRQENAANNGETNSQLVDRDEEQSKYGNENVAINASEKTLF